MRVHNNTSDEVVYKLISATLDHSGTLSPGQTVDELEFDKVQGITVSFETTSGSTFSVIIPETKEGKAVTIGVFFA